MGTRADFYVGRGESAEWLGSVAWDGYPDGFEAELFAPTTEAEWRAEVAKLSTREDWTSPEMGWPWPWENSQTTDFAYAFDGGSVHASNFGHAWFDPKKEQPECDGDEAKVAFPEMKGSSAPAGSKRSGIMVFRSK